MAPGDGRSWDHRRVSALTGQDLWRRNSRRSAVAMLASNGIAAVGVFVYLSWIVPVPAVDDPAAVTLRNLVVFTLYGLLAFPLGSIWSLRRVRPIGRWMVGERPPTPAERDLALRAPLHQALILAAGWGAAAVLF